MSVHRMPNAEHDEPTQRRVSLDSSHITMGGIISVVALLLAGIGAWYDLSQKVALQGQRLDTWVSSLSSRQDRTADELAKHEALAGHPVAVERTTENARRIERLEGQVAELERQRERLRKAALVERVQVLQRKLQAVQWEQRNQKAVVERVQEVAEHPSFRRRLVLLFGG